MIPQGDIRFAAIKKCMISAEIKAFCRNNARHPLPKSLAETTISVNTIIISKDYYPFPLSGELGTIHDQYNRRSLALFGSKGRGRLFICEERVIRRFKRLLSGVEEGEGRLLEWLQKNDA